MEAREIKHLQHKYALNAAIKKHNKEKKENLRIDKVLEDMEHIKFHCDMRYCNWEECKQQVKQSILSHILQNKSEK